MPTVNPSPADQGAQRLNASRARQGGWGRHILVVLLVSTLLAAAGMFIALAFTDLPIRAGGPMTRQETPSEAMIDPTPAPSPRPTIPSVP